MTMLVYICYMHIVEITTAAKWGLQQTTLTVQKNHKIVKERKFQTNRKNHIKGSNINIKFCIRKCVLKQNEAVLRTSSQLTQHKGHRDEAGVVVAVNCQLFKIPLLIIVQKKSAEGRKS